MHLIGVFCAWFFLDSTSTSAEKNKRSGSIWEDSGFDLLANSVFDLLANEEVGARIFMILLLVIVRMDCGNKVSNLTDVLN